MSDFVPAMISDIYESCFSQVGDEFLESVARIIAQKSGTQTVIIHRLLTAKEYIDLKYNDGCPNVQLIGREDDTSDDDMTIADQQQHSRTVTISHQKHKVQYLFVKASYSTITNHHSTLAKYTAAPVSLFPHNSPFIQTIQTSHIHHIQQDDIECVYPSFKSYVGIRLDEENTAIGLISVMDKHPISQQQIDLIQQILSAIKTRTKNEIQRIRQKDGLIMMKNEALRDAESKIKFLAEMSHEIRTPMSAVVALTDLMLQEPELLTHEQSEHLGVIKTSGNHLLTVISDILDISKMNHNPKFKLETRTFNIRKCVKDALNMARHQASLSQLGKAVTVLKIPHELNNNIPLHQLLKILESRKEITSSSSTLSLLWNIDPDIPDYLRGDSLRLTQILLNLCSNAVKFTKSGGIRVNISLKGTEILNGDRLKDRYDADVDNAYSRCSGKGRKDFTHYYDEEESTTTDDSAATEDEQETRRKITLEISVTDTGIGMPADRLPRLFKSFSQIDISTARQYGGTGLGLAISSMLVTRMGGELWVESEEGLGSRFALTLPIEVSDRLPKQQAAADVFSCPLSPSSSDGSATTAESSPDIKKPTPSPPPPLFMPTSLTMNMSKGVKLPPEKMSKSVKNNEDLAQLVYPLKILLAEDNILNQKIALSILNRLGYHNVLIAGNGREALDLMRIHTFDVIFMDLYMPEMDGLEATRCIITERKLPEPPKNPLLNLEDVYIIALTASASKQDRDICINAGMNGFISKPFTMTEMQSALRKLVNNKRKKRKKQQRIHVEDVLHEQIVPQNNKQLCQG